MEHEPSTPIELPKPVQPENAVGVESSVGQGLAEKGTSTTAREGVVAPQMAPPTLTSVPPNNQTSIQADENPQKSGGANPIIADDVDVIEKEWVSKAKQIVEKTKQDPYLQNKEINVFKADYMKKRYGKDLKITSD